jgi:hypothetical protein
VNGTREGRRTRTSWRGEGKASATVETLPRGDAAEASRRLAQNMRRTSPRTHDFVALLKGADTARATGFMMRSS